MKNLYPQKFEIVLHLRAPEEATEDDVRRVLRSALMAAEVRSVKLLEGTSLPSSSAPDQEP